MKPRFSEEVNMEGKNPTKKKPSTRRKRESVLDIIAELERKGSAKEHTRQVQAVKKSKGVRI